MQLTQSETRIIEKARKTSFRSVTSLWVLGVSSSLFLAFAATEFTLLVDHFHKHGLAASMLWVVLSESQHPSHVDILFTFVLATQVTLNVLVAMELGFVAFIVLRRAREQRLLLKFAEDVRKVAERSTIDEREPTSEGGSSGDEEPWEP